MTGWLFGLAEGLSGLRRRWGLALVFVLGLGASLALVVLFLVSLVLLEPFVQESRGRIEFFVELEEGLDADSVDYLISSIEGWDSRLQARYLSKEEALESPWFGGEVDVDEYIRLIGENPLPASLRVGSRQGTLDSATLKQLIPFVSSLEGVVLVGEEAEAVGRLASLLRVLRSGTLVLGAGLSLCMVLLLFLGMDRIFSERHWEVELLDAVGGVPSSVIRRPFVVEGSALGFLGGAASGVLVGAGLSAAGQAMPGLFSSTLTLFFPLPLEALPLGAAILCLMMGTLLGWASSHWLLGRHA